MILIVFCLQILVIIINNNTIIITIILAINNIDKIITYKNIQKKCNIF